jgi:hypothetical protein
MCSPAAIAPLALAAVGSGLQIAGQNQAQRAQAGVTSAETRRQAGYAQAGRDAVDGARRVFDAVPTAQGQAETVRRDALQAAADGAVGGYLPGQSEAARVELDRRRAGNAETMQQESARRAALEAWDDALLGGRLASARSAGDVGIQGSFARGSAGVLPAEMQAAGTRGQNLRTFGDITVASSLFAAPLVAGGKDAWGRVFGFGGGAQAPTVPASRVGAWGRLAGPV